MDAKRSAIASALYKRVLEQIKPSKLEIENTIASANTVMARLKKIVPKDVELMVVGSIARSTNLKGDHDIDIFMLFSKKYSVKQMEKLGLEYAKRIVDKKRGERWEIKYAEHPYTRVHLDKLNIKVDLVPAYKIANVEELATAVDRTPFHTRFMNENLSEKQRDDVRLLKYMLKNHNIYGAEVKVKGFSGYLCELLVYNFGSFEKLLEAAAVFKMPLYINPLEKQAKGSKDIFNKFGSEFVVIDPVDKNRNVAAGVSIESLAKFSFIARKFLDKPEVKDFFGEGFSDNQVNEKLNQFLKKSNLNSYLLVSNVPDKSEDIIWPQLKKTADIMVSDLRRLGFSVYISAVWIDKGKGFLLFLAPKTKIESRMFVGPSIFQRDAAVSFIKAHKDALGLFLEEGRVSALDYNKYETVEEALVDFTKGSTVKKRKDISIKGSKLLVGKIPKEYSKNVYVEIRNKLKI